MLLLTDDVWIGDENIVAVALVNHHLTTTLVFIHLCENPPVS